MDYGKEIIKMIKQGKNKGELQYIYTILNTYLNRKSKAD